MTRPNKTRTLVGRLVVVALMPSRRHKGNAGRHQAVARSQFRCHSPPFRFVRGRPHRCVRAGREWCRPHPDGRSQTSKACDGVIRPGGSNPRTTAPEPHERPARPRGSAGRFAVRPPLPRCPLDRGVGNSRHSRRTKLHRRRSRTSRVPPGPAAVRWHTPTSPIRLPTPRCSVRKDVTRYPALDSEPAILGARLSAFQQCFQLESK
jgi:hypothetical protein